MFPLFDSKLKIVYNLKSNTEKQFIKGEYMRYYKLKQGSQEIFEIEKEQFENKTNIDKPYYIYKESKKDYSQYAVCPACDNPIEIIGLYKLPKNTNYPYGKHYTKSIKDLAKYNQQAYEFCPYSSKQTKVTKQSRKPKLTDFEKNIYNLMREYFDIVVYILSKEIDIKITNKVARELLEVYVSGKSWLYPFSTLNNLPQMLRYLYPSLSLYGQPILKDSPLYKTIKDKFPEVEFKESEYYKNYEILEVKSGYFLDIRYCLMSHKRKIVNHKCIETLKLSVSTGYVINDNLRNIYSKIIEIDEPYFLNLVTNADKNKEYRNQKLLDIAKEVMPSLE